MSKVKRRSIRRYFGRPKRSRRKSFTIPLAVLGGLAPTVLFAFDGRAGGVTEVGHRLTMRTTGYNMRAGNWYFSELVKGWTPILAGFMAHRLANKLGINRAIAQSGIPAIRI